MLRRLFAEVSEERAVPSPSVASETHRECPVSFELPKWPTDEPVPWQKATSQGRRRNLSGIEPGDPIWDQLKKAYAVLSTRNGPLSLSEQGRWHRLPPVLNVDGIVSNHHAGGFFLAWHRAFLYFHERILGSCLADASFRLPVWDWENPKGPQSMLGEYLTSPALTAPCRTWDGPVPQDIATEWVNSLRVGTFREYGGTALDSPPIASGAHAAIHNWIGPLMADLKTAAHDPLFYIHHANVDRHWHIWEGMHVNQGFLSLSPSLANVEFRFWDVDDPGRGDATPVYRSIRAGEVMHLEDLGYEYQPEGRVDPMRPLMTLQLKLIREEQEWDVLGKPGWNAGKVVAVEVFGLPFAEAHHPGTSARLRLTLKGRNDERHQVELGPVSLIHGSGHGTSEPADPNHNSPEPRLSVTFFVTAGDFDATRVLQVEYLFGHGHQDCPGQWRTISDSNTEIRMLLEI